MPGKTGEKKSVKAKSPAAKGKTTPVVTEDSPQKRIILLKEELDRRRKEKKLLQQERDIIKSFWETSKNKLDLKDELSFRRRDRDEGQEHHRAQLNEYRQKLRHVQSEHHATVSELQIDKATSSSLMQNQLTELKIELLNDVHRRQADVREKEFHNQNNIKELQVNHQLELRDLRDDQRTREIEVKYQRKRYQMIQEMNDKMAVKVTELDARAKAHLERFITEHQEALCSAVDEYAALHEAHLLERKGLEQELEKLEKQHMRGEKELSAMKQQRKGLQASLQQLEQRLPELNKQLQEHNKAKPMRLLSTARVQAMKQELRELSLQHELLLQAIDRVKQHRDELLKKQTKAILAAQRQHGRMDKQLETDSCNKQ
ncbi:dynein regulatory complex subunit 4-like [Aulostomus maculatus]